MRSAAHRSGKYSRNITGTVLPGQGDRYQAALPDRTRLEAIVKSVCTSPVLLFSYIAYAQQLVKIGRTYKAQARADEGQALAASWYSRGLAQGELGEIASRLGYSIEWPPCPPANFGEENNPAFWPNQPADRIRGLDFICPSAGTVQSLTARARNIAGVPHNIKFAVYTDAAGSPGVPVAYTNSIVIPPGYNGWLTEPVVGSPSISAGSCFLVFWDDNSSVGVGRTATAHNTGWTNAPFDGWPNPMPAWTPFFYTTYCIYCTYIPDTC